MPAWIDRASITCDGLPVTLSDPVLVRRSKRYCWFPSLIPLADGTLLATMAPYADIHVSSTVVLASRSNDGGLTWDEPETLIDGGYSSVRLADDSTVLLPYYLRPLAGGMGRACNVLHPGQDGFDYVTSGVTVTDWPRPDHSLALELGVSGFVFNGQSLRARDGAYLATLYGRFKGLERLSLVLAASEDGFYWRIRSIIADGTCPLEGGDGPSESAICRLKDGRILCVFRNGSNVPYGQTFSADDGHSWSMPTAMEAFSVEPSLAVFADGALALSGGRPGLYLWLNADGTAERWERIDIAAHHDACRPEEPISGASFTDTSSYTEVIALDDRHLLYIYDRIPHGWRRIPDDSPDTNSVWVVRVTVG